MISSPKGDRILLALFGVSVVLAVIIFAGGLAVGQTAADIVADIWELVLLCPALILMIWFCGRIAAEQARRTLPPDLSEDARRNAWTVARTGRRFAIGFCLIVLAVQGVWALGMAGVPQALNWNPDIFMRLVFAAIGLLFIYIGNVMPKTPLPRAARDNPGPQLRLNRISGWVWVLHGATIAIGALLLPAGSLAAAWLAAFLSMLVLSFAVPFIGKIASSRRAS